MKLLVTLESQRHVLLTAPTATAQELRDKACAEAGVDPMQYELIFSRMAVRLQLAILEHACTRYAHSHPNALATPSPHSRHTLATLSPHSRHTLATLSPHSLVTLLRRCRSNALWLSWVSKTVSGWSYVLGPRELRVGAPRSRGSSYRSRPRAHSSMPTRARSVLVSPHIRSSSHVC